MVFAAEAGVIIRTRAGRTLLAQSRGIDVRKANQAVLEAINLLDAATQSPDPTDLVSNIQGLPMLCGSLHVLNRRYLVVYRVVGQMLFLVVAHAASTNAFSCLNMLNQAVRVVLAETKSADLSQARIEAKYAEIYLSVDALLGSGGVLEANGAMARAHATLEQLADKDKAAAAAAAAAADKVKPAEGGEQRAAPGSKLPQLTVTYRAKRTINSQIQQLSRMSFNVGHALQNVRPRPMFDLQDGAPRGGAAGPGQGGQLDPFAGFGGTGAAAATATNQITDDDIFGLIKASKAAVPAAAAAKDPQQQQQDLLGADPFLPAGDWTDFGKDPATAAKPADGAAGFGDHAFSDSAAFPAALTPPPVLVPPSPVLALVEVWRGEVAGGKLTRASVLGQVEWVSEEAKGQVNNIQFTLQVPPGANTHVAQALSAAHRHEATVRLTQQGAAQPLPQGVFIADGPAAKQHRGTPLMRYKVPAAFCRMPLQVHLGATTQPMHDGQFVVTVGLQYMVNADPSLQCGDLSVELAVPALLDMPLRTTPGAQYDGQKRQLRWQVSGMAAGRCDAVAAVFLVSADEAALAPALRRLQAMVSLASAGKGGSSSLTGLGLAQGAVELEDTPARVSWQMQLVVSPGL